MKTRSLSTSRIVLGLIAFAMISFGATAMAMEEKSEAKIFVISGLSGDGGSATSLANAGEDTTFALTGGQQSPTTIYVIASEPSGPSILVAKRTGEQYVAIAPDESRMSVFISREAVGNTEMLAAVSAQQSFDRSSDFQSMLA